MTLEADRVIRLRSVNASYRGPNILKRPTTVLRGVNATFRAGDHVAILGPPASGKTTLLRIICGMLPPNGGRVERYAPVSFPVGHSAATKKMSAGQYIQFIARCYSVDPQQLKAFVIRYSGIGDELSRSSAQLHTNLKVRLHFSIGYGLPFAFYLFDGRVAAGDPEFRARCLKLLAARRETSGIIVATRDPRLAREFCRSGGVLHDGTLTMFPDVEQAISFYSSVVRKTPPPDQEIYFTPTETVPANGSEDPSGER